MRPQDGPQTQFLSTPADIAIYGGAAGGGKTWSILAEPLRHINNPSFSAVIFRRTNKQITKQGSLWDQSTALYPEIGATPKISKLLWEFDSGARVAFSHLELEKDKYTWQGTELPLMCFDELTHFTRSQFNYMLSRSRSTCGVRPYIRATCNPDPNSFVKELISWWLDPDTGFAIKDRSGVLRWFVVRDDQYIFASSPDELYAMFPDERGLPIEERTIFPKSLTFIASTVFDNKVLLEKDPGYLANLHALNRIDKAQLLDGNWNVCASDGIIDVSKVQFYDDLPPIERLYWSWDTAIKDKETNDFSVGQLWAECHDGYYLIDSFKQKMKYPILKRTAQSMWRLRPSQEVLIEDKASGQQLIQEFRTLEEKWLVVAMLPGKHMCKTKIERAHFASTAFDAEKVFVPNNQSWVKPLLDVWANFPNVAHDDEVDAMTQFFARVLRYHYDDNEFMPTVATSNDVMGIQALNTNHHSPAVVRTFNPDLYSD